MITPNQTDDGEQTPDASAESKAEGACVPVAALAVDGTEPAAGDETDVNAKLRITKVEGGKAYFELSEVNGEAVTADPEDKAEPDEDDMMKVAQAADSEDDAS